MTHSNNMKQLMKGSTMRSFGIIVITFGRYLRYGIPATLVTLLIATADVALRTR